jgi:hypothetical protein
MAFWRLGGMPRLKFQTKISKALADRRTYLRSVYAETLIEDFFIAAVSAVVVIRFYLWATGYPQIGGGGIHIAHVLFGGLLMAVAMMILLAFITPPARTAASIIGGAGFGTFIDEIGKFVTSDNNYFFEPAIALIYLTLMLLFFGFRFVIRRQTLSREERLLNAFHLVQNSTVSGLDAQEARLARALLETLEQEGLETINLKAILGSARTDTSSRSRLARASEGSLRRFETMVLMQRTIVEPAVIFSALITATPIYLMFATIAWSWGLGLLLLACGLAITAAAWFMANGPSKLILPLRFVVLSLSAVMSWAVVTGLKPEVTFQFMTLRFVFPVVSAALILAGLILIPYSRLMAYRMFARATLIAILFTQVFAFYQYQSLAVLGLAANVVIILALRLLIREEEENMGPGAREDQNPGPG